MSEVAFSDLQQDAITELVNLGIGRAADALSQMVSEEILLSVPEIVFTNARDLQERLNTTYKAAPAVISQCFSGDFSGNALLVIPDDSVSPLVEKMLRNTSVGEEVETYTEDALLEIGNIVLNACFGQLGDLLSTQLDSGLPEKIGLNLSTLFNDDKTEPVDYLMQVMLLQVDFSMSLEKSNGFVVFIMSVASMQNFKQKIDSYLVSLFN